MKPPRVLMFGWEFSPHQSGGLGVACEAITRNLTSQGVAVTFVLPRLPPGFSWSGNFKCIDAGKVEVQENRATLSAFRILAVCSPLKAYGRPEDLEPLTPSQTSGSSIFRMGTAYSGNLWNEIHRYATVGRELAFTEDFDLIHAHDWLSFPAALAVGKASGKPLIAHIHSTEFDRAGDAPDREIIRIEREGLEGADRVVAVSARTKDSLIKYHDIPPGKIQVIHNGIEGLPKGSSKKLKKGLKEKYVLFLGRITAQKGPERFVEAARRVLGKRKGVRFIMAGAGDLLADMIELIAEHRLEKHFHFTGFLNPLESQSLFQQSDLFIMPSVSEPFGLVALEAASCGVPVIVSSQSGVVEVLPHAVQVDFLKSDDLVAQILDLLENPAKARRVAKDCLADVRNVEWKNTAAKLKKIYQEVTKEKPKDPSTKAISKKQKSTQAQRKEDHEPNQAISRPKPTGKKAPDPNKKN